MQEVLPTQMAHALDAREWLTEELEKRDQRRGLGSTRTNASSRSGASDNHEVQVYEPFVLRYVPSESFGTRDGYVMTTEVPAGTKVFIFGRYSNVKPGATLLTIFRGQEALVTLRKGRGFRKPEPRNKPVRRTARAA